jgi:hypothetical protein
MITPSTCPQNRNTPPDYLLCFANLEQEAPPCVNCPTGQTLIHALAGKRRADSVARRVR